LFSINISINNIESFINRRMKELIIPGIPSKYANIIRRGDAFLGTFAIVDYLEWNDKTSTFCIPKPAILQRIKMAPIKCKDNRFLQTFKPASQCEKENCQDCCIEAFIDVQSSDARWISTNDIKFNETIDAMFQFISNLPQNCDTGIQLFRIEKNTRLRAKIIIKKGNKHEDARFACASDAVIVQDEKTNNNTKRIIFNLIGQYDEQDFVTTLFSNLHIQLVTMLLLLNSS